jgi:hypothetical protein
MDEIDLEDLGLDEGGHLLLKRALTSVPVGGRLHVSGAAPELALHLSTWCRAQGHRYEPALGVAGVIELGGAQVGRWRGAERTGAADAHAPDAVVEHPPARWGLAARGAALEAGAPDFEFRLADKDVLWADDLDALYRQAAANPSNDASPSSTNDETDAGTKSYLLRSGRAIAAPFQHHAPRV